MQDALCSLVQESIHCVTEEEAALAALHKFIYKLQPQLQMNCSPLLD